MTILHVDVNSAFLSWTAVKLLSEGYPVDIREIPSVIAAGDDGSRHAIVLAKSVPAKRYGIKTADTMFSARKACPNLVSFLPDFELFKFHSDRMFELLSEYSPVIERYSIDECFIDYTGCEALFGEPLCVAHEINRRIREELGFTVNVGVGPNRLLAKMASDFEKPDKVHTLFPDEIEKKMWPLPVDELFMCGRSSAKKLHSININTIGELAHADLEMLLGMFKSHGRMLWEYANGIDDSPVSVNDDVKEKSVGNSITTKSDLTAPEEAYPILLWLCEKTVHRMRKAGFMASVITVQFRNSDFVTYSHQMKVSGAVQTVDEVYAYAKKIFNEGWHEDPLRLVGVSLGGLVTEASEQLSFLGPEYSPAKAVVDSQAVAAPEIEKPEEKIKRKEKSEALENALAQIRDKYGNDSVGHFGSFKPPKRPKMPKK